MRSLQQIIDSLSPAERAKVLARGRQLIATLHLLRSPANARRLVEAVTDADTGKLSEFDPTAISQDAVAPAYNIDDLVKKITPENRHTEIDTGAPVGNEIPALKGKV